MRISTVARLWLLVVLSALFMPMAAAQPSDSAINFGGLLAKKPPPAVAPPVRAPPTVWPRLERGSVLCRSEADLLRRAAVLRGEPGGPADCRVIAAATGIQIVHRYGPGRTEVRVNGTGNETGWTDAWLPATPPPGSNVVNTQ